VGSPGLLAAPQPQLPRRRVRGRPLAGRLLAQQPADHYADGGLARVTFVDTSQPTPRYTQVLLVEPVSTTDFVADAIHADSVVWFDNHLLVGTGRYLQVFDLRNLARVSGTGSGVGNSDTSSSADGMSYVLPYSDVYTILSGGMTECDVKDHTVSPCINGMSYDAADHALVTSEYLEDSAGARIIRWPFDTTTEEPREGTADAAWSSPVWAMQGVTIAHGDIYTTGLCPSGFPNGNRYNSCVHTGAPGTAPHVLTPVPDGSQNLDYDSVSDRIWGVNEMITATDTPLRVVFDILSTPDPVPAVRFRNVATGMCLMPYHFSINPGADVVLTACNGENAQNWYWDGPLIRNYSSRECLTIQGGWTTDNAPGTLWDCDSSNDAHQWTLQSGNGGNMLVNGHSHKCLTFYGGTPDAADGTDSVQWTCNASDPAHAWTGSS
jgi:ricin-type beta-trefoil lectin protein